MNKPMLYGGAGLLLGALISWIGLTKIMVDESKSFPQASPMAMDHMSGETMSGMVDSLKEKTGDEFDREFLKQMIDHHKGAIEMAKLVETKSNHEVLKDMAKDVINTQSSEVQKMQQWQQEWGN